MFPSTETKVNQAAKAGPQHRVEDTTAFPLLMWLSAMDVPSHAIGEASPQPDVGITRPRVTEALLSTLSLVPDRFSCQSSTSWRKWALNKSTGQATLTSQ